MRCLVKLCILIKSLGFLIIAAEGCYNSDVDKNSMQLVINDVVYIAILSVLHQLVAQMLL